MGKHPTVAEVLDGLGRAAPWGKAAGWDPIGLQLGDRGAPVRRAAVCHEVGDQVVAALEQDRPELLVTYHPLLFRPVTSLLAGSSPEGRAYRLVRSGVALAVAHTNFDVARGGAADALGEALGLSEVTGFGPVEGPASVKVVTFVPEEAADRVAGAMADAGAGVIGNYSRCSFRTAGTGTFFAGEGTDPAAGTAGGLNREPEVRLEMTAPRSREAAVVAALTSAHPYEEPAYDVYERRGDAGMLGRVGSLAEPLPLSSLAALVGERLRASGVRWAGDSETPVRRVAVVPGSGADLAGEAAAAGADALVTGDVSHHRAWAALERGLAVIDAGHAPTERPGVGRLLSLVEKLVAETVDLTGLDPNPWRG